MTKLVNTVRREEIIDDQRGFDNSRGEEEPPKNHRYTGMSCNEKYSLKTDFVVEKRLHGQLSIKCP